MRGSGAANIWPMQGQYPPAGNVPGGSAIVGAGAVLGTVATGAPYNPAFADALAMRNDQIAVAGDFWGAVATVRTEIGALHPGQGNLFEQR